MKVTAEELWKLNRDTAYVCLAHPFPARGVSKDPPARPYYDVAPERTL